MKTFTIHTKSGATIRKASVRSALAFAASFAVCSTALARQATVRGFVTDADSEQPLQGATVALIDADEEVAFGTATDGDGYYLILRVPGGPYSLRVSFVGYTVYEEPLSLASNVVRRDIVLSPLEFELDQLVVEAEAEGNVATVSAGLQKLQGAEVERVPMPGVAGDLASYLQTVPGIVAQGDRGGQFFVRGGSLDQNLALMDGIPVYLPFHIISFYSAFSDEIINTVDLYTGGFGARYGGRISSVMDVRARNGNKQALAGAVAVAPFLSSLRVEGPILRDRASVILQARRSLIEEVVPNLLQQRLEYTLGDFFGKFHAFVSPSQTLSVTAFRTFDRGDLAGTQTTFEGDALSSPPVDSNDVAWDNEGLGGRYTYSPQQLPLLVEASGAFASMTNEIGPSEARERTASIESIDLSLKSTLFLGRHSVTVGGLRRSSDFEFQLGGQFQNVESGRSDLTEYNFFAESELATDDRRVQAQPGVHVYRVADRGEAFIEPRVRLSARPLGPASRHQLHFAAGRYHQSVVALNDERDVGNLYTAWLAIPDDQPIQASTHLLAGWSMEPFSGVGAAVEAFIKDFDNLTVPVFSAFPGFTTSLQQANGRARGVDVRLDLKNFAFKYDSVIDGFVSYGLSEVEYETAALTYHPSHDRRHQFSGLVHAQRGEVGLTVQLQVSSGLPFNASAGFDQWYLLTPDVDVTRDPARDRVLYEAPFAERQPLYQRLDIWIDRKIERGRYVATLRAGAVNVLNRNNLFYFDLFTFRRVDQLPLIPSVGFKMELR